MRVAHGSTAQRQWLTIAVPAALLAVLFGAKAQDQCQSSPITLHEAIDLLEASPPLLEVKSRGATPAPVAWEPTDIYHHSNAFFYFDVRTANSDSADGGLIGYFAVSKRTARVFDISVEPKLLTGGDLDTATRALRIRHCITDDILAKTEGEKPEN